MNAYSVSTGHHQLSSDSGIFDGILKFNEGKQPDEVGSGFEGNPELDVGTVVFDDLLLVEAGATVEVEAGLCVLVTEDGMVLWGKLVRQLRESGPANRGIIQMRRTTKERRVMGKEGE